MPGIIGYNTIGGSTSAPPGNGTGLILSGLYVAVAGDVVDQLFFYGHDGWSAGGNVDFAIYDISAGLPNNRIGSVVNIAPASSTAQWWASASGLGIALTAGVTYTIALAQNTAGRIHYDALANCGSENNAVGLPASWTHNVNRGLNYSMYANVIAGASPPPAGGKPPVPAFNPIFGDF